MPQLDKLTFMPVLFWTLTIYSGGYLLLNATFLYGFFSSLKLMTKRSSHSYIANVCQRKCTFTLTLFPLISLYVF